MLAAIIQFASSFVNQHNFTYFKLTINAENSRENIISIFQIQKPDVAFPNRRLSVVAKIQFFFCSLWTVHLHIQKFRLTTDCQHISSLNQGINLLALFPVWQQTSVFSDNIRVWSDANLVSLPPKTPGNRITTEKTK